MPPDDSVLSRFNRLLAIRQHRCRPDSATWHEGTPARQGSTCVFVDGWASQSTNSLNPRYDPLLHVLGDEALEAKPEIQRCALSYAGLNQDGSGKPYCPFDTFKSLTARHAHRLIAPYAPREGVTAWFCSFSLGGALLLLGMADWLRAQPDVALGSERVKGVVLIQPLLSLKKCMADLLCMDASGGYQAILDFAFNPHGMSNRMAAALSVLRDAGIDVTMLYWDGDGMLDYSGWHERFEAVGAIAQPLDMNGFASIAESDVFALFSQHCMVPQDKTTKEAFRNILRFKDEIDHPVLI